MSPLARTLVALLVVLALVSGCQEDEPSPSASTLERAFMDPDGDAVLESGPGEPLRDRTELVLAARTGRELARFAQVTDAHVRDEESPARPTVLDRLGPPFTSAFRPQEALSAQVLTDTVRAVNRFAPRAVVVTGDLVDNAQENELTMATTVLRGGTVRPNSGRPGYEGPQDAQNADPLFYRPEVDAPRHRGLLERAQRPFRSPGLRAPWFPVLGNHDALVQGVVAPTPTVSATAVGDRALVELDPDLELPEGDTPPSAPLVDRFVTGAATGRRARVSADPDRRLLSPEETVRRLRRASALRASGSSGDRLDHAFDLGPNVRAIALDLVRREGGAEGRVDPATLAFLARELARAGDRHVVVFSHQGLEGSEGGAAALALLDRHPQVVAVVSGHAHRNRVRARRTASGGYWLISTASLADYPQQARAFRLLETAGGGVALETWMLDQPPSAGSLSAVARELAFVDAQGGRPAGSAGTPTDRNLRLFR